jgi:hypothetical protein
LLAYDADSFVAVTGQIAGAWGRTGIPARWQGQHLWQAEIERMDHE